MNDKYKIGTTARHYDVTFVPISGLFGESVLFSLVKLIYSDRPQVDNFRAPVSVFF